MYSQSRSPLPLPSLPDPSGSSQCTSPEHLSHASNLGRFQSLGQEDPLEKEMATHSSVLAWKVPWTDDPGRLQSTGSQRVGHDWVTSLSLSTSSHCILKTMRSYWLILRTEWHGEICALEILFWLLTVIIYKYYVFYESIAQLLARIYFHKSVFITFSDPVPTFFFFNSIF